MLTTDFTGTYDYEKTEAEEIAAGMAEELRLGYSTVEEMLAYAERERAHWRKVLPSAESFDDFDRHFTVALQAAGIIATANA